MGLACLPDQDELGFAVTFDDLDAGEATSFGNLCSPASPVSENPDPRNPTGYNRDTIHRHHLSTDSTGSTPYCVSKSCAQANSPFESEA